MATQIFINLPVKDLQKSIGFFTELGFSFNPQFTDENATCMIVDENIFFMLLVEKFFNNFTDKKICDTSTSAEAIFSISRETREQVIEIVNKAVAAGGSRNRKPEDHGWMYQESFMDIDGHLWEVVYLDPKGIPQP